MHANIFPLQQVVNFLAAAMHLQRFIRTLLCFKKKKRKQWRWWYLYQCITLSCWHCDSVSLVDALCEAQLTRKVTFFMSGWLFCARQNDNDVDDDNNKTKCFQIEADTKFHYVFCERSEEKWNVCVSSEIFSNVCFIYFLPLSSSRLFKMWLEFPVLFTTVWGKVG